MKILHAETGRHLYGGALQVALLMKGLEARGCGNLLLCPEGSAVGRAVQGRSRVVAPRLAGGLDPRFALHLLHAVRSFQPHLIHTHSRRGADYWGGIVAALTGTPAVVSRRVDNPEPILVARAKYRCYDRVISISQRIREVLLAAGMPAEKVVCVHSGIDTERYGRPCDRQWFLREFGLEESQRVLAAIGQLIPRKGHRVLVEALPEVIGEFPGLRVLLCGVGNLEGELKELCHRYGLSSHVRFAGFRTDLERILPCLELVVHPALTEGLGLSLLEAAAAGIPIVAASAGGVPEIVQDGVTGLLVAPGDPKNLAGAMIRLLRRRETAQALGKAGRDFVRRNFSVAAMVEGNIRVYRDVLAGTRGHEAPASCRWLHP
jgi:glycosyltransferase involved in cell wall biosynthesis